MRSELLQIVMRAQVAATTEALNNIRASHMDRYGHSVRLKDIVEHKLASALVKEAGLPGFLMQCSDELKPLWVGRIGVREHESWTNCAVYSLEEAKAFAKTTDQSWFEEIAEGRASTIKEGDTCPDCNDGYVREYRNKLCCRVCGSDYHTEHSAIQKLGHELSNFYAWDSGPGRVFQGHAYTRLTKRHIVVTQHCGYDI